MKLGMKVLSLVLIASSAWAQSGVVVDVTLNPMGDFKAKTSNIKGEALVNGSSVEAKDIEVDLSSLKTGIELRDKHTLKYLDVKQHPKAVLVSATGSNGKGTGRIRIRGVEKDIAGTYKVNGRFLQAQFPLTLSEFGINDVTYMGVGVEDQVTLNVTVPIKEKGLATSVSPVKKK